MTTANSNDITIGAAGAGSVSVANLAQILIGDDLFIGASDGGSGSLTVTGFGSIVDANDQALVGQAGVGTIDVTAGGRFFADDTVIGQLATGDGRVTITGQNTLWRQTNAMTVGDAGRGTLQVLSGAKLETTNVVADNAATSVGQIEIAGAGSAWDVSGFMNLCVSGASTLNVREGGRLANTGNARLASAAGSESFVEVSGTNSSWAIGTTLNVGEFGFGKLEILDGGRVTSTDFKIGDNTVSRGEAVVDGDHSTWDITGSLDISEPGEAKLTISLGGLVTTSSFARVNAAGTLVLDGGRLSVNTTSGTTNNGLIQGTGTITGLVTNTGAGEIRVAASDQRSRRTR